MAAAQNDNWIGELAPPILFSAPFPTSARRRRYAVGHRRRKFSSCESPVKMVFRFKSQLEDSGLSEAQAFGRSSSWAMAIAACVASSCSRLQDAS